MAGVDATVRKETLRVLWWVLALCAVQLIVFALLGRLDLRVVLGTLLGAATAVGNFFLMGLTVQKAVSQEQKDAKNTVRLSQSLRLLMQGLVLVIALKVDWFFPLAALLPLFYPRISILLRPVCDKLTGRAGQEQSAGGEEK